VALHGPVVSTRLRTREGRPCPQSRPKPAPPSVALTSPCPFQYTRPYPNRKGKPPRHPALRGKREDDAFWREGSWAVSICSSFQPPKEKAPPPWGAITCPSVGLSILVQAQTGRPRRACTRHFSRDRECPDGRTACHLMVCWPAVCRHRKKPVRPLHSSNNGSLWHARSSYRARRCRRVLLLRDRTTARRSRACSSCRRVPFLGRSVIVRTIYPPPPFPRDSAARPP
jgi:hypothetical protein